MRGTMQRWLLRRPGPLSCTLAGAFAKQKPARRPAGAHERLTCGWWRHALRQQRDAKPYTHRAIQHSQGERDALPMLQDGLQEQGVQAFVQPLKGLVAELVLPSQDLQRQLVGGLSMEGKAGEGTAYSHRCIHHCVPHRQLCCSGVS